jgi:Family of unknown function (DUF6165)
MTIMTVESLRELLRAGEPILAEISPGELLDKITILEIKRQRLEDDKKKRHVQIELDSLLAVCARCLKPHTTLDAQTLQLKQVNQRLWDIEDEIRQHESRQDFGPRFIELARSVYLQNDERSRIKRRINDLLASRIVEEKSYKA